MPQRDSKQAEDEGPLTLDEASFESHWCFSLKNTARRLRDVPYIGTTPYCRDALIVVDRRHSLFEIWEEKLIDTGYTKNSIRQSGIKCDSHQKDDKPQDV